MRVDVTNRDKVIHAIKGLISQKKSGYICVSNVHMCMETFDSEHFRKVVNSADLVIPDGRPLLWTQRLMGFKEAQQVRGQDITNEVCSISQESAVKIGLYGGSDPAVLDKVETNLRLKYPNIKITYKYSPPFRALTDDEAKIVQDEINRAEVDVLFVGIGCPKQEKWMYDQKGSINAVMLGVGAAFDFIAGTKKHAPIWMQKAGLEWLFRLIAEPRRLWKRYLKQNPRFIWHTFCQCVLKRKYCNT